MIQLHLFLIAHLTIVGHSLAGDSAYVLIGESDGSVHRDKMHIRRGENAVLRVCAQRSVSACESTTEYEGSALRWFLLRAVGKDYENSIQTQTAVPIAYSWHELKAVAGHHSLKVREVPELTHEGTYRIAAFPVADTPSLAAESWLDRPQNQTFELVVRRGDDYVGYVSELLHVPFVFWPRKNPAGQHQTDERLGADCVALVIYGQRRLGNPMPYVSPLLLKKFLDLVAPCDDLMGPCTTTQASLQGAVLHFGFQTAVISVDTSPVGTVNETDLVMHTYHGVAEEVPVHTLPYRHRPLEIYRWPASTIEPK